MEAVATSRTGSPCTATSQICEPRVNPAITLPAATRMPQAAAASNSVHAQLAAPASQESIASMQSNESSALPLQTGSSRSSIVSSQLTSNTDATSPSSSVASMAVYDSCADGSGKSQHAREKTPESSAPYAADQNERVLYSPMSITSPAALNGTKRTASGHVKNAPSLPSTPLASTFGQQSGHRPRQQSISSTGSRASELAANLKTRLGYAMAKVQHGWEHNSLLEVEQLAAQQMSPNRHSILGPDGRPSVTSPSNGNASLGSYGQATFDYTASPPSKRHSGHYPVASYLHSLSQVAPMPGSTPQLQPAVDIRPSSSQRHSQRPPSHHADRHSDAMLSPHTPVRTPARRPPTIRTQTQTAEAERDALQALFQLGSPHGSQIAHSYAPSQANSSQASPLRSDFLTPRKVAFAWTDSNQTSRSTDSYGDT